MKGDNMTRRSGTLDRATGLLVDAGHCRASEVKTALGIINHQVWQRTLAAAGIEVYERPGSWGRVHWITFTDARRLLAGRNPAKPP